MRSLGLRVRTVAGLLATGCGGGDGPSYARLDSCPQAGWQPTGPLQPSFPPGPLAMTWADGLLYQAMETPGNGSIIVAPADGGDPTVLVENDWARSLWIEGDNLLYTADDRLMQVPL